MTARAISDEFDDEGRLLARVRQQDPLAVRALLRRHNRRLYRLARGVLRDDAEAEDALQEAYVQAFANLDSFRGEAKFTTWLSRIVINQALMARRRRRPTMDIDQLAEAGPEVAEIIPFPGGRGAVDPEGEVARGQIRVLLEGAIDRLPDHFRVVVAARLIEGMNVEETADLLALTPQTVKTRLHRARALLKRDLEKQVGPMLSDAFPFAGWRCDRLAERLLGRLGWAQS